VTFIALPQLLQFLTCLVGRSCSINIMGRFIGQFLSIQKLEVFNNRIPFII
jgi:hypothetical protein